MKKVNKAGRLVFHSIKEVMKIYFPKDKIETDLEQKINSIGTGLALDVINKLEKSLK